MVPRDILITGGTGYIGRRASGELAARGHDVRVLVRPQSRHRAPSGASVVEGNALDTGSVALALRPGDTLVHLVGTPHPNPSKASEFRAVDLASIKASVAAGIQADISHLVYVSVAHPAPVMKDYVAVRMEGEQLIRDSNLRATILRPWYVIGPGHWWPIALLPFYGIASLVPSLRGSAQRLGLVMISQMVSALVFATEHPPQEKTITVMDVPAIRSAPPQTS